MSGGARAAGARGTGVGREDGGQRAGGLGGVGGQLGRGLEESGLGRGEKMRSFVFNGTDFRFEKMKMV